MSDVPSERFALELYSVHALISELQCSLKSRSCCGNGQHAPTGREKLAFRGKLCARVINSHTCSKMPQTQLSAEDRHHDQSKRSEAG